MKYHTTYKKKASQKLNYHKPVIRVSKVSLAVWGGTATSCCSSACVGS